ncbi:oxidoreductase [Planctomycetota bacterium]|nr:oxidoreductase [Planctomycetota bacterium]
MTTAIRNARPPMQYRRFGRTGLHLSCITLGGMRYVDGWSQPRDQVPTAMLDQCARMVDLAFKAGVNHIETAHGYGKSEHCYGQVLNDILKIPRDQYWLMTKGAPKTGEETRRLVDEQLRGLRTDHIDLYGWHGINTPDLLTTALAKGGPVETLLKLRDEGVIGHVGFSTHGRLELISRAILTGMFSFVNLHYYYFFQRHRGAVDLAGTQDMGVFIISPNDKGGQLFSPSAQLVADCAPLTPIQFNARWCLASPRVHTLSFGMTEPAHVSEMLGTFPAPCPADRSLLEIIHRLDGRLLDDPIAGWDGYELQDDPSGINIAEVLRFRRMLKCHGMETFGKYRYNMLEAKGHWFPGSFALPELVTKVEADKAPPGVDVRALLGEAHARLYRPKTPK